MPRRPNGSRLSCSLRRPKTRIIAYRYAAAAAGWQLQALVRRRPLGPPDRLRNQLEPPDPFRPSRAVGTRRMTRIKEDAFRCGERHSQYHPRPPLTGLPDIGCDRLWLRRSILSTEPMWCRVEVEREKALLRLWPDVGPAHVTDGECRAVDEFAVEMELEDQRVTTRTATEPMPDELLSRRRRSLARCGNGHQR